VFLAEECFRLRVSRVVRVNDVTGKETRVTSEAARISSAGRIEAFRVVYDRDRASKENGRDKVPHLISVYRIQ
jgi:hypothetical protein